MSGRTSVLTTSLNVWADMPPPWHRRSAPSACSVAGRVVMDPRAGSVELAGTAQRTTSGRLDSRQPMAWEERVTVGSARDDGGSEPRSAEASTFVRGGQDWPILTRATSRCASAPTLVAIGTRRGRVATPIRPKARPRAPACSHAGCPPVAVRNPPGQGRGRRMRRGCRYRFGIRRFVPMTRFSGSGMRSRFASRRTVQRASSP